MNRTLKNTVASAVIVLLSAVIVKAGPINEGQLGSEVSSRTHSSANLAEVPSENIVKKPAKEVAKEEKEESAIDTVKKVGDVVIKELNGTFFEDYMKVAKSVEAKVDEAMEARKAKGLKANKWHEIGYRIKFSFPMLKFVATRAIMPIVKVLL